LSAGRVEQAKRQFEMVLQFRPDWTDAMGRFAWLLATNANPRGRDPAAAIALAEHANQMTLFDQPDLLDALAAAYASAGRFDAAVSTASRAHDLAAARGFTDLAKRIGDRLALYRSNRAFVATTQASTRISPSPTAPGADGGEGSREGGSVAQ